MKLISNILKLTLCAAIYATNTSCDDNHKNDLTDILQNNAIINILASEMSWMVENKNTKEVYHMGITHHGHMLIKKMDDDNSYYYGNYTQTAATAIKMDIITNNYYSHSGYVTFIKLTQDHINAVLDFGKGLQNVTFYPIGVRELAQKLQNAPNFKSGWNIKNIETGNTNIIKFKSNGTFTVKNTASEIFVIGLYVVMSTSEIFFTYSYNTEHDPTTPYPYRYNHSKHVSLTKVTDTIIKAECDFGNGMQHFELY